MREWDLLLEILEASLKKHGDQPLKISHLINIMKMVNRLIEQDEDEIDRHSYIDWHD